MKPTIRRTTRAYQVQPWQPLTVALTYKPAFPCEVEFEFQTSDGKKVAWAVGRELLDAGLQSGDVGEGDFRIVADAHKSDVTWVHLRSPVGRASFTFSRVDLEDFLSATYEAVPFDKEFASVDWDSELQQLLGGAA